MVLKDRLNHAEGFKNVSLKKDQYKTTTAKIAPNWIEISNVPATDVEKDKASPNKIKWAVDDTGINSVSPSIIPKKTALI